MKIFIKNVLLFIISIILIIMGSIFYLKYTEQPHTHWNNTNEMNMPDIFQYGWIPRWFPKNATNIHEQHNIDTNCVWIKFELLDNNDTEFIQHFNVLGHQKIASINLKAPFLSNWWFDTLFSNEKYLNLNIYQGNDNNISNKVFLAKAKLSHTYYIWILEH